MSPIVYGIAFLVLYVLVRWVFGTRTVRVKSERHDVLRLPDGGMVHDANCRNHACRNHVRQTDDK